MAGKLLSVALLLILPLPADAAVLCAPGTLIGNVTYVPTAERIELSGIFMVRLQGLAALGVDEPGGSEAKAAMRAIALGKKVRCELSGEESDYHCIAVCYLDDVDIAEELIRQGRAKVVRDSRNSATNGRAGGRRKGRHSQRDLRPAVLLQGQRSGRSSRRE